ncbi:MAG: three-Cys-motif partner protein TcmP [Ignavibacteriales bacterium]|nr:three-Cys-motif partner protein TcmP [Ignavibacteriales bacterium]
MEERFGGNWRLKKLKALKDYLIAYRQIFSANEKARHFKIHYIDVFAGKGELIFEESFDGTLFEVETTHPGSAKIALDIPDPFHYYHFIELEKSRCDKLEELKSVYPWGKDRINIYQGDGKRKLLEILSTLNFNKDRAVVFLDPYGMDVEFDLLKNIAETRIVDLWILVPHAVGFMRQLQKEGKLTESNKQKLNRVFGEEDWFEKFYNEYTTENLFGDEETFLKKAINEKDLINYYNSRLKGIFIDVAPSPLILKNDKKIPIFALCFAASNEKGSTAAIKIAKHLLEVKHGR